jgi:hypothetical protein
VSGVAVEQQKSSQRSQKPVRTGQVGRAGSNAEQHADKAQQQKVKIDLVGDKRELATKRPPPNSETVNALFQRLVDKLNLPPDQVAELNLKTQDQKWQLILAQHELRAGVECFYYIEQLQRHTDPVLKERKVKSKLLANLQPLGKILKDLEVDLRSTTDDAWIQEFVSSPNHGHVALLNVLKDALNCPEMPAHKNPKKSEILTRAPGDVYTCLLCIKALMGHRRGFNALVAQEKGLYLLTQCMKHSNKRIKALLLKLMIIILLAPGGNNRILQMFNHFYRVAHERHRWSTLVKAITEDPVDPAYQAAALTFINTTIQTASTLNAKVYLQNDFILAGFNPETVEKSLGGRQDERVLHELREWHANFINVNVLMDDLAVCRGRNTSLKEELQSATASLEERKSQNEQLLQQNNALMTVNASQKSHMDGLQDRIKILSSAVEQRDTLVEENRQLAVANEQYKGRTEEFKSLMMTLTEENEALKENFELISSKLSELDSSLTVDPETIPLTQNISLLSQSSTDPTSAITSLISTPGAGTQGGTETTSEPASTPATESTVVPPPPPIAPPPPPMVPPPPPPPPGHLGAPPPAPPLGMPGGTLKQSYTSRVQLPMLNWTVVKNITKTVFEELNDKRIVSTLNFREFERLFEARKSSTFEKPVARASEKVTLFESKRSENLVIAKRRIGQSAEVVMEYILHTDLDGLWGDYCELLLKLIPNQDELAKLSEHAHEYDRLGEAEQFMFHLAKIERYQTRLRLMAFMSTFDEMYGVVQPKVESVLNASLELFRSTRLKKVFEVVLAFGNYMNSSRRGMTTGFRPETLGKLADTKSNNRKMTLLHYIVRVVEAVFPHAATFYEDLNSVEAASQVSIQMIGEDVLALRNGIKLVANELEKQPSNFIIFSFHSHAYKKVHQMSEQYKRMDDVYREVCQLFSEEPYPTQQDTSAQSSQTFCNFFTHFQRFIWDWKRASEENERLSEFFGSPRSLLRGEADALEEEEEDEEDQFVESLLPRATVGTNPIPSLSPVEEQEMTLVGVDSPTGGSGSNEEADPTGSQTSFYKMYTLNSNSPD